MVEGYWIYDDLQEHREYYEQVPLHIHVEDKDDGRTWIGDADVDIDRMQVRFSDGGTAYCLSVLPSKDANRLHESAGFIQVATKCYLRLTPQREVTA